MKKSLILLPLLALSLTASPVHAIGHADGHFGKSGSHSGKSGGGHFGKLLGGRNGNHTGKHDADKPNSSFKTSKNEHGSSKKPSSKSTTKKSYSLKKSYSHKETDNIFQKNNLTKKYQDAYHHQSILTNPWIWLYFINNHRHQAYDRDGSTNVEYTKGYHDGWEAREQSTKKNIKNLNLQKNNHKTIETDTATAITTHKRITLNKKSIQTVCFLFAIFKFYAKL